VNVRPDGGAVAWIDVIQRPPIVCPFPPCGTELERNLIALDAGKPAARSVIVAEGLMSAGWLGSSLLRQAFGDGERPWFICAVTASAGCVRNPAFSPDARRVAFVRGRDLYVVRTGGGAARRLARGVSSPSRAQR
jgi:hypothetical protein